MLWAQGYSQGGVGGILVSHSYSTPTQSSTLVSSAIHPVGNIGLALVKAGWAKCVDQSSSKVTGEPQMHMTAKKWTKENKLMV